MHIERRKTIYATGGNYKWFCEFCCLQRSFRCRLQNLSTLSGNAYFNAFSLQSDLDIENKRREAVSEVEESKRVVPVIALSKPTLQHQSLKLRKILTASKAPNQLIDKKRRRLSKTDLFVCV